MSSLLRHRRLQHCYIYVCLALFIVTSLYIQIRSFATPYSGILVEQNRSLEWTIAGIQNDSIAANWNIAPGDRIVSVDGQPTPKIFTAAQEKMLIGATRIEVLGSTGLPRLFIVKPTIEDKLENGLAFLMELFLIGVGGYAFLKKPGSHLIHRFFLLNVLIASTIITLFSDEIEISSYLFSYCAVWLPYVMLSFYLLFAFRSIYAKFRFLLMGYLAYAFTCSAFTAFFLLRREVYDWVSHLLNIVFIFTLLLMAGITAFYWKKLDRIEQNQLFLLFVGIFTSLMPYVLLYALPELLRGSALIPAEYVLIGLVPVSGTLAYLLVQRQIVDMKFYITRLSVHSLYYSAMLVLFLLAAVWDSLLYAAGLFILFGMLTFGYQRLLLRLQRQENRKTEWLEHQKLRLSLQLAEKKNIRDILKLSADLLHDLIDVEGLTLVYMDDNALPLVYSTGIYLNTLTPGTVNMPDNNDWSGSEKYAQVIELSHGTEEPKLGYLCLGLKTNHTLLSAEEHRLVEKFRSEAIQMLLNARQTFRLRQEYEQLNKVQAAHHERRLRDLQTYSHMALEAREAEKIRISYFLHDDLLQNLIFLSRDLEELYDTGKYERERNATWLKCLYDSQRSIRSLSDQLYPHILDKGDLQEALHWLLRDMNRLNEVAVTLQYEAPAPEPFPSFVKTNLFRALRELIVNVFKHAEATEIYVRVWMGKGSLYCIVSDNGKGFSEATARPAAERGSGFGLMSVCDQMEHLGGSADIDSVPGQGTTVTLKLPLVKEITAND